MKVDTKIVDVASLSASASPWAQQLCTHAPEGYVCMACAKRAEQDARDHFVERDAA